ncbi:MAG: hypothetical protein VB031_05910, partial [Eubacteriaceae bacterium]|nr:hypothetical protein [Eubacteriaceae bacterium]
MSTRKFSPAAKAMAFVLAVLITVTGFNTGWAQAEDNSIDVDTKVTYDDSKSTAEITFDLEKVGKQGYETQQILDADGNKVFAIEKAEKA